MSVESHRVLIGACGWEHQAWLDDFYSEELPEEWRLGFYANEFPVVYLAANRWLDNADLLEWSEDISDSFRFILELPGEILSNESRFSAALEQVEALGEFCLGLVLQPDKHSDDDIALFQKQLKSAQSITTVCLDKRDITFSDEWHEVLSKQNISEVWHGKSQNNESLKRGALSITHILGKNIKMPDLRNIIEGCLAVSTDEHVSVLCIDGEPPSLELLRNADIILNLL